jgi:hypothetical protein
MSKLQLRIFDGTRQPFSAPAKFLVTITDGNKNQRVQDYYQANDITFDDLPFFDNFGDNYTVLVWADGFQQAGFTPVTLSDQDPTTLDVMLIGKNPGFSFVNARWNDANASYPFLGSDVSNADGEARFDNLLDKAEKSLACLLNLGEAMSQINLSQGTPLDYIKQALWDVDHYPAQDRFFAWCDARLVDQVRDAARAGTFAVENNPGTFHPGATSSWKQIEFGEANVQLTFHENDKKVIGGVDCVMVEPDIDYFQDLTAHGLCEVIPNALTHSLTDPTQVYVLRWMAGRKAGIPEFAPLYTITS